MTSLRLGAGTVCAGGGNSNCGTGVVTVVVTVVVGVLGIVVVCDEGTSLAGGCASVSSVFAVSGKNGADFCEHEIIKQQSIVK